MRQGIKPDANHIDQRKLPRQIRFEITTFRIGTNGQVLSGFPRRGKKDTLIFFKRRVLLKLRIFIETGRKFDVFEKGDLQCTG